MSFWALKSYCLIIILVLGLNTQAQTGNLIYNGNFESWDTALYPQADLGDKELCKTLNIAGNEKVTAFCLKGVGYAKWLPYIPVSEKCSTWMSIGGSLPAAYKNCYPTEHVTDFGKDTNFPLKGSETFIGTGIRYDSVNLKYTAGKFFLYLPLIKPLNKGKSYKLDFDIKTAKATSGTCNMDTADFYGCKGFGFGFTEKVPDFIQDPMTYETNLVPEVKLGYFNKKVWTSMSQYFVADSNAKYIIFGFFDKGINQNIYSKSPACHYSYGNGVRYTTYMLDNLYLKEINDTLLPKDTSVCLGKEININCIQGKPIKWKVNGIDLPGKSLSQLVTANAGLTVVVATDSIVSDTMYIHGEPYPQFNVIQTDTLCNDMTAFIANPNSYKYTWLPENISTSSIQLKGNNPRQVIALNAIGCADTLDFIPVLGSGVCGTFFVPSAFSPNLDATNEVFGVVGTGITSISMQIFNSWGELIYDAEGQNIGWDGTFDAQLSPQGIYLYKITVTYWKNGKTVNEYLKGTVSLLK